MRKGGKSGQDYITVKLTRGEGKEKIRKFKQIYYSMNKEELNEILATIDWKIYKY